MEPSKKRKRTQLDAADNGDKKARTDATETTEGVEDQSRRERAVQLEQQACEREQRCARAKIARRRNRKVVANLKSEFWTETHAVAWFMHMSLEDLIMVLLDFSEQLQTLVLQNVLGLRMARPLNTTPEEQSERNHRSEVWAWLKRELASSFEARERAIVTMLIFHNLLAKEAYQTMLAGARALWPTLMALHGDPGVASRTLLALSGHFGGADLGGLGKMCLTAKKEGGGNWAAILPLIVPDTVNAFARKTIWILYQKVWRKNEAALFAAMRPVKQRLCANPMRAIMLLCRKEAGPSGKWMRSLDSTLGLHCMCVIAEYTEWESAMQFAEFATQRRAKDCVRLQFLFHAAATVKNMHHYTETDSASHIASSLNTSVSLFTLSDNELIPSDMRLRRKNAEVKRFLTRFERCIILLLNAEFHRLTGLTFTDQFHVPISFIAPEARDPYLQQLWNLHETSEVGLKQLHDRRLAAAAASASAAASSFPGIASFASEGFHFQWPFQ